MRAAQAMQPRRHAPVDRRRRRDRRDDSRRRHGRSGNARVLAARGHRDHRARGARGPGRARRGPRPFGDPRAATRKPRCRSRIRAWRRRTRRSPRWDRRSYIRDLGSATGTWVNGSAVTTPKQLRSGDKLRIGGDRAHRPRRGCVRSPPRHRAPASRSNRRARRRRSSRCVPDARSA